MYPTPIALARIFAAAPGALAHGCLKEIIVSGVSYPGWAPYADPYITPAPVSFKDNGSVPDFTSADIACNTGGNIPIAHNIPAASSSMSGTVWGLQGRWWKCVGDQWGYKPDQTPPWGSDKLATRGASWTVTVPKSLASANYLLRHEILGMGAQFYPSCAQIQRSLPFPPHWPHNTALPGAYQPEDKGILAELWRITAAAPDYTPPGGPVWTG
ncbi:glycosyl hydrolase family 61-domain-containing protein [Geopyxis carbonaria]|nr:glycosyl hydrolase family 61-domain-containing protein [Geopyxis carbonaria]